MARNIGPKIINDGLIYCFDAGDTNCYPGTGTVCKNLAVPFISGDFLGGTSFSSENGGCIVTDGVDDYVNTNIGYNPGTTGNLTIENWTFPTGPFPYVTSLRIAGFIGANAIQSPGYGNYIVTETGAPEIPTTIRISSQWRNNVSNVTFLNPDQFFPMNVWYHIIASYNRTTSVAMLYINGILIHSTNTNPISGTNSNVTEPIVLSTASLVTNMHCGGKTAIGRIYNRALTSTEMLQNFNAVRGRFGI